MKLLTKQSDYAMRALIELSLNKGLHISAKEIALRQHMPYQFVRHIMGELIKGGLVSSKEGGKGGFTIQKDPKRIRLVDVIRIFQGTIQFSDCLFKKRICASHKTCILRKENQRIERLVEGEFEKITVASLIGNKR